MTEPCTTPLSQESLVDYLAGDLSPNEQDALELHLLGCAPCTAEAERVARLSHALRSVLPPVIGPERLQRLREQGARIVDNPMLPGEVKDVLFPRGADVLLQRLGGLELSRATRVSLRLCNEHGGATMLEIAAAPFDRARGEVLIACQQHFESLPHDVVFEVVAHDHDGGSRATHYVIRHRFEQASGG